VPWSCWRASKPQDSTRDDVLPSYGYTNITPDTFLHCPDDTWYAMFRVLTQLPSSGGWISLHPHTSNNFFPIFTLLPMVGGQRPNPLHTISSNDATSIVIKYIIQWHVRVYLVNTRVGTLIVATIYLQLIQNRYMFRSFTVLQCGHQHCVQPVASDVEVVGYL